jgi:phosphopantothenoylcysteine decarboxylase/phosphopantothenate--cysteine ligase
MLTGKSVLLGVSGGIACYKALDLTRLLVDNGACVHVVMTREAMEFVTPLSFQTLSKNRVATSLFDLTEESEIGHIRLADQADIFVIAPATANVVSKLACGIGDDLLTTISLACTAPILIAPAMNVHMYENPIIQDNIHKLKKIGHFFTGPAEGALACGYEGKGRLVEPVVILEEIRTILAVKNMKGERVLVTAGPTEEPLDPARLLTNRSSGKMGFALATICRRRGAEVILVSGPTSLPSPHGVTFVQVDTAEAMRSQVLERFSWSTAVFMAAAVCDYHPCVNLPTKMKKDEESLCISLERTPDVLQEIGKMKDSQILVGFAAETDDLIANARSKLRSKNLDLVVANNVLEEGVGFRSDTNRVTLIARKGEPQELPLMTKEEVAEHVVDWVANKRAQDP